MKTAVITGLNGQDGFYLARLLLGKGYRVVGVARRTSTSTAWRLDEIPDTTNLIQEAGDITDYSSITRIVKEYQPDEFYNLAAQSQVWHSFKSPLSTCEITGMGALNCLEAVRQEAPQCRFYQAGSSEQFGNIAAMLGTERDIPEPGRYRVKTLDMGSPMIPRSPYGAAKFFAHNMVRNYREAYNMFVVGGILFNHESPHRGVEFVTRKITDGALKCVCNHQKVITLGNLDARRDWGHAEDYMQAAWMMLQQDKPKDYVIATGETYSISQFLTLSFMCVGVDDWKKYVDTDAELMRPSEIDVLIGDSQEARDELGWSPKYSFLDLVYGMMEKECERYNSNWRLVDKQKVAELWESSGKAVQITP